MKQLRALVIAGMSCLALNSFAASVDLISDKNTVELHDQFSLQVRVNGLVTDVAPSLGAYDFNLNYDSTLFSLSHIVWGDAVFGNQLALSGFGSIQDSFSSVNQINLAEVSLDDALVLNDSQADNFTLFTLVFNTLTTGSGNFSLTSNAFGDAYGIDLPLNLPNDLSVDITAVPLPASGLLLLSALLPFFRIRRKFNNTGDFK